MALHSSSISGSQMAVSELVLQTNAHRWVIPYNCEILKAIIAEKNIQATDLQFRSQNQCHGFIKHLLLLAAADECRHCAPSQIAVLARELIFRNPNAAETKSINTAKQ